MPFVCRGQDILIQRQPHEAWILRKKVGRSGKLVADLFNTTLRAASSKAAMWTTVDR
jgi:hypothetical protein